MDFSKFRSIIQGINFAKVYTVKEALKERPDYGANNIGRIWNQSVQTYSTSQQVEVVQNCTGYMFTNLGDVPVRVNGMVVFPGTPGAILGDSRSVSAHWLDIYRGRLEVIFLSPTAGVAPLVEIVQVFYIPGNCKLREE